MVLQREEKERENSNNSGTARS